MYIFKYFKERKKRKHIQEARLNWNPRGTEIDAEGDEVERSAFPQDILGALPDLYILDNLGNYESFEEIVTVLTFSGLSPKIVKLVNLINHLDFSVYEGVVFLLPRRKKDGSIQFQLPKKGKKKKSGGLIYPCVIIKKDRKFIWDTASHWGLFDWE